MLSICVSQTYGYCKFNYYVLSKTSYNEFSLLEFLPVKALNQARLEANVRVFGEKKGRRMWPSPYTVASGVLLLLSSFKFLYHPLNWLALGGAVVGLPPILMRSIAAVRRFTLDINLLMLIAGNW